MSDDGSSGCGLLIIAIILIYIACYLGHIAQALEAQ